MTSPLHILEGSIVERLRSVFALDEVTIDETLPDDFNRYFRSLLWNPSRFCAEHVEIFFISGAGPLCGHVLDLASGFGVAGMGWEH